ncbi:hypothetical protein HDU93_002660 [Gonapodya sp. JEL0774]|nr:hypothetical protein HDU93_002660 [Gonapodya sp. JEL0774]
MQVSSAPPHAATKSIPDSSAKTTAPSVPRPGSQSREKSSSATAPVKKKAPEQAAKQGPGQSFTFRTKYKNNPPPLPFEPKLLKYPFDRDRLNRYVPSELTDNDQLEVWPQDHELGLPVNLFTLGVFERELQKAGTGLVFPKPQRPDDLDPKDAALLVNPDQIAAAPTPITTGSAVVKPAGTAAVVRPSNVTWLRKTQYISADASKHLGVKERQVEHGLEPIAPTEELPPEELLARVRASVERSFDSVKTTDLSRLRHPSKPELRAMEAYPLVPDFENWAGEYLSCVYQDGDPLGTNRTVVDPNLDAIRRESALLKPTGDEHNITQALYLPTDSTAERILLKRKRADAGEEIVEEEGEVAEFKFIREYDYERLDTQSHTRRLLVALRPQEGAAVYNIVKAHMLLKKARTRAGDIYADNEETRPALYKVRRRNFTLEERERRRKKFEDIMEADEAAQMVEEE